MIRRAWEALKGWIRDERAWSPGPPPEVITQETSGPEEMGFDPVGMRGCDCGHVSSSWVRHPMSERVECLDCYRGRTDGAVA